MMCPPCDRSSRRRGRHRAHPCERGGATLMIGYVCSCPCNAPSSSFVPPPMVFTAADCKHPITLRRTFETYQSMPAGSSYTMRREQRRLCLDCGAILPDDQEQP